MLNKLGFAVSVAAVVVTRMNITKNLGNYKLVSVIQQEAKSFLNSVFVDWRISSVSCPIWSIIYKIWTDELLLGWVEKEKGMLRNGET
ncbi:hypothetical protein BELL_0015g00410 [Botrytis elliptica]|uniref:Uncharacterized protein n=1 Tax=Botrytis elliptica TaxID=278938 RepID=A0A4Z1K2Y0_9HELO|nr:hypothetical protein EAE99_001565 [Botrytis elliptica]TGO80108.1 hypothetical protein BELL_0015g00410 [Botrytis elliptica]